MPSGIVPDRNGWRAFQRIHKGAGGLKSKRFPKATPEREMRQWQEDQRVSYRQKQTTNPISRDTLAADAVSYLKLVATMPSLSDRKRDLQAWVDELGTRRRRDLTVNDYRLVLQRWRVGGKANGKPLAASTVNHRRTALMHLYSVLDGKGAHNPLRDIPAFVEPHAEPRDLGFETALAILSKAKANKTGARLRVLMWTGIRGSSEFGKMTSAHVDLERGVCWVPTGKGGKARELALNQHGIAAWQAVIDAKAWGHYSKSSLWKAFQRCVAKVNEDRAKANQPPLVKVRPYDLRHTIATWLRRSGADLADVQAFLGHQSQKMTQRYSPYTSDKLRTAIDGLGERVSR